MNQPFAARLIALAVALVPALSLGSAAQTSPPPVTEHVFVDPSKPIEAWVGQLFLIALESNPSTGYHWTAAPIPDPVVAELRGSAYQAGKPGMMGAPGQEVRVYQAVAVGTTTIALDYVSPGTDAKVGKSVKFTVTVRQPGLN